MDAKIYDLGEAEELLEALEDVQEFIPYMIFILKYGIRSARLHAERNGTITDLPDMVELININ